MAKEKGKVTRLFKLTAQPVGKDKYAVSFSDVTSRSDSEERVTTTKVSSDSFSSGAFMEGIELQFERFKKTLKDEDPGELFADVPASGKPKRDPKA
jgi:hypothetical protein